jgi:hypothetical protein
MPKRGDRFLQADLLIAVSRHEITSMWPNPSGTLVIIFHKPVSGPRWKRWVGHMDGEFVMDAACESQTSAVKVLFKGNG